MRPSRPRSRLGIKAKTSTMEAMDEWAQRVKEMYATGLLRQIWKRGDTPGAAIVWEAGSEAEVRATVESLPIYEAGMLELSAILPLEPYAGFGPSK